MRKRSLPRITESERGRISSSCVYLRENDGTLGLRQFQPQLNLYPRTCRAGHKRVWVALICVLLFRDKSRLASKRMMIIWFWSTVHQIASLADGDLAARVAIYRRVINFPLERTSPPGERWVHSARPFSLHATAEREPNIPRWPSSWAWVGRVSPSS